MVWKRGQVTFDTVDDMTDDPVVAIRVTTPAGLLTMMAEPVMDGNVLVLKGFHIQDSRPNAIGQGNLAMIARTVMERMDLDELIIKGAVRTTGACPGRRPADIRFKRGHSAPLGLGSGQPADD
jgi:hypothetical protein